MKTYSDKRQCHWADFRQALKENHGLIGAAFFELEKRFPASEVAAAYKDYQAKMNEEEVRKAMFEENSNATLGRGSNPKNVEILNANAQAIADVIRQGAKEPSY